MMLLICAASSAQKPFAEGTIVYHVKMISNDKKEIPGTYTFVIKGNQIRKEIRLNNGYQDVVLLNCGNSTVYSLQNRDGKKYAIELNMGEMLKKQERYKGILVRSEQNSSKTIAGVPAYKGKIAYTDGTDCDLYYSNEWVPTQSITFERFPYAKFFPVAFSYKDENGITMQFEAERIETTPVENAVFRIPTDYKIISNAEYKQMSK